MEGRGGTEGMRQFPLCFCNVRWWWKPWHIPINKISRNGSGNFDLASEKETELESDYLNDRV